MKSSVKKIIAAMLCLSFIVTMLASCKKTDTPDGSTDGTGTTTPTTSTPDPDPSNVKINYTDTDNLDKVVTEATFDIDSFMGLESGWDVFGMSVIYSHGMVLQANKAARIWGSYPRDCKIAVKVESKDLKKTSVYYGEAKNGEFEVWIGPTEYGGPYSVTLISEEGFGIIYNNVLFGEVFVLAGQSNMGWTMSQCYDGNTSKLLYADIIANCANDNIREMLIWPTPSEKPVEVVSSCRSWSSINSSNIGAVSACGYFFAAKINAEYDVPVGIIHSCMGGTGIDRWVVGGDCFNGITKPIVKYTARAVLWYQGEGDYNNYGERLASMIGQWREEFDSPNLPFAIVQLPRYANEDAWFRCREEDKKAASLVKNATYCVTIDTGLYPENKATGDELNNDGIHPYEKKPVGERLADAFMKAFYGKEGVLTSTYMTTATVENGKVKLKYDNVGHGLVLVGKAGYEVAGEDGVWYAATPEISGKDTVVLTCDKVKTPVSVRYGYSNYSELITEPVKSCSQSVCLYNTASEDMKPSYPGEQFLINLK